VKEETEDLQVKMDILDLEDHLEEKEEKENVDLWDTEDLKE